MTPVVSAVMPENAYLDNRILTADREELILLLYDGALRFARQAVSAFAAPDVPLALRQLVRAQGIIHYLDIVLDAEAGGELGKNLARLYEYVQHRFSEGGVGRNPEPVHEGIRILARLRDAWREGCGGPEPD